MSKSYSRLLSFILVLFTCLLLMLCYFSRLATDDYYFIWDVRNKGILNNVYTQYMEWCGRFAATFAMDIFYKVFDVQYNYYRLFPFISAVLLFFGVYFLLGNISAFLKITLKKPQRYIAAASFVALLFFLSIDIGESWFWFCGLSSYLWSIIVFVWACVFLSNSKSATLSTIAAIMCFVYIGGASEVYSAIYGLFFTCLLFRNYRRSSDLKVFMKSNQKMLLAYFTFAISFLIFLLAPGNYLRDGLFPEHQFWYSFFITAKSFVKFAIFYLPFKLPYIVVFAFPFLFLGDACKAFEIKALKTSFKSFFIRISLVFAATLFIFFFMVAYVMVETGPPRMWLFVSFLLSIYCCIVLFYLGYKGLLNDKALTGFKNISIVLGICLMLFHMVYQYPIASAYSKAADERIEFITGLNKTIKSDSLVYLPPLPPSGMLYSAEIASDTNHFTNKELRLGYELKFHVVLRK